MILFLVAAEAASSSNTTANIITAVAAVITALGGLAIGVSLLVTALRTKRTVGTIHTIVNQQRTDAQRYNIALTELLKKHGIEVPIDQSLPVVGEPDAKPGQPT